MTKNTIRLKNYLNIFEELVVKAVFYPGMLVKRTTDNKAQAHNVAGGNVLPIMFALEDELQGGSIDDPYAIGSRVQTLIPQRGDQILAILEDGENVVIGDALESAGNGYLKKHVADISTSSNYPNQIVGTALEAMDLSDSSGAESSELPLGLNKRIQIQIV